MTAAILTLLLIASVLVGAAYILVKQRRSRAFVRDRSDLHQQALWLLDVLLKDETTTRCMLQTRSVRPEVLERLKVRSGELPEAELLATVAALLRDSKTRRVAARCIGKRTETPEGEVRKMLSGMVMEMRGA